MRGGGRSLDGLILTILVLAGCASTYEARSKWADLWGGDGFTDTQLGPDVFGVTFHGNEMTSSDRTSDFALLRGAELTLDHGFRYFIVMNESNSLSLTSHSRPTQFVPGVASPDNGWVPEPTVIPGQLTIGSKPSSRMVIRAFSERPQDSTAFYDAEFVARSIREKYHLPAGR